MKAVFWTVAIVLLVVGALVLAGWMSFDRTEGKATITIETSKVRQDAKRAVEQGQELLEDVGDPGSDAEDASAMPERDSPRPSPVP